MDKEYRRDNSGLAELADEQLCSVGGGTVINDGDAPIITGTQADIESALDKIHYEGSADIQPTMP